jgi:transposase
VLTGGFELACATALQLAGLAVATDLIDARVLADMARELVQRGDLSKLVKPLPDAQQLELQGLVTRRRQLMAMKLAEDHRMKMPGVRQRRSLNTIIKALDREISRVDKALQAFVSANDAELAALLESVKGLGKATISTQLAEVPELESRTVGSSAPCWGWRRSIVTPARCVASARFSADARTCSRAVHGRAGGLAAQPIIRVFYQPAAGRGSPSWPSCASC